MIHAGDLFFNDRFPFVDLGSGGSVDGYIANMKAILDQTNNDTLIIPGHGDLAKPRDYWDMYQMIVETQGMVRRGIAAGKSLGELQSEGLPEKFKQYDDWITEERWIETLYHDSQR